MRPFLTQADSPAPALYSRDVEQPDGAIATTAAPAAPVSKSRRVIVFFCAVMKGPFTYSTNSPVPNETSLAISICIAGWPDDAHRGNPYSICAPDPCRLKRPCAAYYRFYPSYDIPCRTD